MNINRNSLERKVNLGRLYDSVYEEFVGEEEVFVDYKSRDYRSPSVEWEVTFESNVSPYDLLIGDDESQNELKLSMISGLLDKNAFVVRFNKFFAKHSVGFSSDETVKGFLVVKVVTNTVEFAKPLKELEKHVNRPIAEMVPLATHYVTQILYGYYSIVYFERKVKIGEDKSDLKERFQRLMNRFVNNQEMSVEDREFVEREFKYSYFNQIDLAVQSPFEILKEREATIVGYRMNSVNEMSIGQGKKMVYTELDTIRRISESYGQSTTSFLECGAPAQLVQEMREYVGTETIQRLEDEIDESTFQNLHAKNTLKILLLDSRSGENQYLGKLPKLRFETLKFKKEDELTFTTLEFMKFLISRSILVPRLFETKSQFIARTASDQTLVLLNHRVATVDSGAADFDLLFQINNLPNTKCGVFFESSASNYFEVFDRAHKSEEKTKVMQGIDSSNSLVFHQNARSAEQIKERMLYQYLFMRCPCGKCPVEKMTWTCMACCQSLVYQRRSVYCGCGGEPITDTKFFCKRSKKLYNLEQQDIYKFIKCSVDVSLMYLTRPEDLQTSVYSVMTLFSCAKYSSFMDISTTFNAFDDLYIENHLSQGYITFTSNTLQVTITLYNYHLNPVGIFFDHVVFGDPTIENIQSLAPFLVDHKYQDTVAFSFTSDKRLKEVNQNLKLISEIPASFKDLGNYYLFDLSVIKSNLAHEIPKDSRLIALTNAFESNFNLSTDLFNRSLQSTPIFSIPLTSFSPINNSQDDTMSSIIRELNFSLTRTKIN